MANSDIVRYLDEGLKRGFSIDVLKNELIENGFLEKDIDEAEIFVSPSDFMSDEKKSNQKEKKGPTGFIKFISILYYISAGICVFQALFLVFFGNLLNSFIDIPEISGVFIVFATLILMISLLLFFIARGLWTLKNWTRVFILIFSWFGAIVGAVGMFAIIFMEGPTGLAMILPLIFSGLFIWYFQYNKEVVALFKQDKND